MPSGCPIPASSPLFNISELLQARWDDTPQDERMRLEMCWGIQDCGDCHRSKGYCGWCPISGTCLPLPVHTHTIPQRLLHPFPLISPIIYSKTCALASERFEIRTSGLGCQVSTITFLTSVVSVAVGIALVFLIWLIIWISRQLNHWWKSWRHGTEVVVHDVNGGPGMATARVWVRGADAAVHEELGSKRWGWIRWPKWEWRRWALRGGNGEEGTEGERNALLG